jgi:predicted phosphodiesterase
MKKVDAARVMVRQGDILLQPVNTIPKGAVEVPTEQGAAVLAYGESHGHRHQFAKGAKLFARGSTRFIEVSAKGGALLTVTDDKGRALLEVRHEEIRVAPGAYEVVQQLEWTASDEARTVQD